MALSQNHSVGNYLLELENLKAASVTDLEVGSIKTDMVEMPVGSDYYTQKAGGNLTYSPSSARVGISQGGPIIEWITAVFKKNVMEKSGAILVADFNFKEQRRADFTGALISEITLDDFDANNNKKPYGIQFKFETETLAYAPGSGAQIKGDLSTKQKAWNPANFRAKFGDLPCDWITAIKGIGLTCDIATEYHGQFRVPNKVCGATKMKDVTITFGGPPKVFAEVNKWAISVLQDGNCADGEEISGEIAWLDPTLKKTLGNIVLKGMGLNEIKFSPKMTHNDKNLATFDCTFRVEEVEINATHLA